ncbi:MAG: ABC transporter ATP-binding protein [Oscillospiraceae bacterium]|nr:ABC transporter ATP-binding protein [Oscillospiraceae bacterium]MCI8525370.1 ABC transporter ATP-binding protein [Oscillospiraceae bacterium]
MAEKILEILDLETQFVSSRGVARAVDRVSYSLHKGEILGVVGESGCGKSVTALSILGLVQSPPGRIAGGQILLDGEDLLKLSEQELQRRVRGDRISMIFQEPMTSLNPLFTVGEQLMEPLRLHRGMRRAEAKAEAIRMLSLVGIPMPERRFREYPHSLSGGMRQRVMIAMALCCDPEVLIADEPTTALDVTIQAQILDLMKKLRDELGTAILMITHDLGVVAEMCDRAVVMYCGSVVEEGTVQEIFKDPRHPYTQGLIASIPKLTETRASLYNIPGTVPNLLDLPAGCRFADRCEHCTARCRASRPAAAQLSGTHLVRCFQNGGDADES